MYFPELPVRWGLIFWCTLSLSVLSAQTLRRHPANPRYLEYQGKPILLIGGGEHYGAVLNLDFDYRRYLNTLEAEGIKLTRLFTGSYVEKPGAFGIQHNTLAPAPGKFICPWARSTTSGYVNGGNQFDLERWDEAYFQRMKDFMNLAAQKGVIVELVFFSSLYGDDGWRFSPLHPDNNINLEQAVDRFKVHTLDNGPLLKYQEQLVRKLVRELNAFDNLYYEIQNEPWADLTDSVGIVMPSLSPTDFKIPGFFFKNRIDLAKPASLEWQAKIAAIVRDEETGLPKKHLIAQNYCNHGFPLAVVDTNVDIINFHYVIPEAAALNYGHERPVSCDETGFFGSNTEVYRKQLWHFALSGGAIWNHLDYSFFVGKENGTGINQAPGAGSTLLRSQFRFLREFMESFCLPEMAPMDWLAANTTGARARVMGCAYGEYAVYLTGGRGCNLRMYLPRGEYKVKWIDPVNGQLLKQEIRSHNGGLTDWPYDEFDGEAAVAVRRDQ